MWDMGGLLADVDDGKSTDISAILDTVYFQKLFLESMVVVTKYLMSPKNLYAVTNAMYQHTRFIDFLHKSLLGKSVIYFRSSF